MIVSHAGWEPRFVRISGQVKGLVRYALTRRSTSVSLFTFCSHFCELKRTEMTLMKLRCFEIVGDFVQDVDIFNFEFAFTRQGSEVQILSRLPGKTRKRAVYWRAFLFWAKRRASFRSAVHPKGNTQIPGEVLLYDTGPI